MRSTPSLRSFLSAASESVLMFPVESFGISNPPLTTLDSSPDSNPNPGEQKDHLCVQSNKRPPRPESYLVVTLTTSNRSSRCQPNKRLTPLPSPPPQSRKPIYILSIDPRRRNSLTPEVSSAITATFKETVENRVRPN